MIGGMIMLLQMMFCVVFFGLPLLGMVAGVIKRVAKNLAAGEYIEERAYKESRVKQFVPVLENPKIVYYQLVESRVHKPMRLKGKYQCRAGPSKRGKT